MLHLTVAVLLLGCVLPVFAQTPASDVQMRPEIQLTMPLHHRLDLLLSGQMQIGQHLSRVVNERVGAALQFRLTPHLLLSPGYQHFNTTPSPDRHITEHRLIFSSSFRFPSVRHFAFANRNAFERRLRKPAYTTRFRNRLSVEHPLFPDRAAPRVYVSDEVFYDWGYDAWVRNQFAVGVVHTLSKHLSGDVYYMRQDDSRARPGLVHAFGAVLRMRL